MGNSQTATEATVETILRPLLGNLIDLLYSIEAEADQIALGLMSTDLPEAVPAPQDPEDAIGKVELASMIASRASDKLFRIKHRL